MSEQSKSGWEPAGQASQSFDLVASRQDVNFVNRVLSDLTISGKKTNETGTAKAGWKITLTGATLEGGAVSQETTTASDGSYSFTGLLAGSYNVTEESKPGWEPVGAAGQTFDLVTSRNDVNFVNRVVSGLSISGKKNNETGTAKSGWKITLTGTTLEGGTVSEETATASDGSYSFTGQGQAASDQRLKKSQRSYEHGFGSYQSEELVSTAESYMARDLAVSYDPAYGYGKWKAGIWSKSLGQSYLGQEITGADYIQEETKAAGLSDMSTNLSFQGKARLRAVSQSAPSEVDLDEEYVGQYTLQRTVHLGGVSRFDRPHITLNKTGRLVPGTAAADYSITVLNDGNAALGPVYVWDIFPAGTDYLGSSQKPDRLQPGYANWSLLYLSIGQSVNINLRLNVTDQQDELVNVVYASGGHNGEWVSAGNMSVMQFGWLSCCQPEMLVEKQARIDAVDNSLIWYRILLKNQANVSLVAQVTDRLPVGLKLLNASAEPQVQGQNLVWVTAAIPAGESRFIEYLAQATSNGKFVNTARIEAHARDGSGGSSTEASATVTVGEATSYAEDGWRPPEWGLDRSEMICDDEIAGEGASCATGGCPV